jgi:hypothetical protein
MKKLTSLLIGCTLALAGATLAQQPDEQPSPNKGKKPPVEKTQGAEQKAGTQKMRKAGTADNPNANEGNNKANPEATTAKQQRGMPRNQHNGPKGNKAEATPKTETSVSKETNTSTEAGASATAEPNKQARQGRKGAKGNAAANNARTAASATPAATATPATGAAANTPSSVTPNKGNRQVNAAGGGAAKKLDVQKVQQIKQQHANFRAQPRPDKVPAVTFQQNYRIQGSDRWQGPQYEVYRSYHPERHDQGWYRSHYSRVELVGGGYYYWNNGYWFPAWGYSPSEEYYAYDAPIYAGQRAEPPDQVIADVQAELQDMGYYQGEVDGLLGPQTREALTSYQSEQGLEATAVIDEPTLDSLGMNS